MVTGRLQLMHDLEGDRQLHTDVTYRLRTPALQAPGSIAEEPCQSTEGVGIVKRTMPGPFHHFHESWKPWPEGSKVESFPSVEKRIVEVNLSKEGLV
jgi:hypothetical protein